MRIVSRQEWGASAPTGNRLRLPVREVWLHHSVTQPTSDPVRDMKTIERIGVQRFGRYSYSYAVHPSGVVLEGAGHTVGAHTKGRNSISFGVVAIGNYENTDPPAALLKSIEELLRHFASQGWAPGQIDGGHRDLTATKCPGVRLYRRITDINRLAQTPREPVSDPIDQEDDMLLVRRGAMNGPVFLITAAGKTHVPTTPDREALEAKLGKAIVMSAEFVNAIPDAK